MASLKFALLLSIGLFGSALTSAVEIELKMDQDALENDTQTGAVCQNCTEIFELFAVMFSNPDLQDEFMDEKHCDNQTASSTKCNVEVKKMLPLALNMIFASMVQRNNSMYQQPKMLRDDFTAEYLLPQGALTCMFCKSLMNTLISMLPVTRTEEVVVHAMEKVCHILPFFVRHKCTVLIDKYGKEILELILKGAAASAICFGIRLC